MGKRSEDSIGGDGADGNAAFFFGLPFGVAGKVVRLIWFGWSADGIYSLADEEE